MSKIADIIKYEGDNSTFIWKHPCEDFNSLTQLIVHESQEAVFFMNGQALDLFGPGRHTLETQNIPEIGKRFGKLTGGDTPFHCEVYFINQTVQMGFKWGTPDLVRFVEPTMGIPLSIGASGELNLQVCDSRKLLVKLVGTMKGIAWGEGSERRDGFTKSLQAAFRPMITTAVKNHLANAIKDNGIDIVEVDSHLELLSEALRKSVDPGFRDYGLTVPELFVTNVLLPENDPNFKRLRDMHALSFRAQMAKAEADVRTIELENARRVEMEAETTVTEKAKREAERELIKAQVKAESAKMEGFAEAEVMRAQGYNQKDVLQAEVQKAYAAGLGNMTITGGGGSVAGDMIGLGVGMAAAGVVAPQIGNMFSGFAPNGAQQAAPAQESAPVQCPQCGKEMPANAKFCLECGAKIEHLAENEMLCPQCGKKTPKGKFCMECGAPLVRKCAKCGSEIPNGAKFCLECGEKL